MYNLCSKLWLHDFAHCLIMVAGSYRLLCCGMCCTHPQQLELFLSLSAVPAGQSGFNGLHSCLPSMLLLAAGILGLPEKNASHLVGDHSMTGYRCTYHTCSCAVPSSLCMQLLPSELVWTPYNGYQKKVSSGYVAFRMMILPAVHLFQGPVRYMIWF